MVTVYTHLFVLIFVTDWKTSTKASGSDNGERAII